MNRYEFEDKISDYLENQLSISESKAFEEYINCLLYTSPSPRDRG